MLEAGGRRLEKASICFRILVIIEQLINYIDA